MGIVAQLSEVLAPMHARSHRNDPKVNPYRVRFAPTRIGVIGSLAVLTAAFATASESVSPTSISFPTVTVGLYAGAVVDVTNTGSTLITVTSVSVTPSPVFYMANGLAPASAIPGQTLPFDLRFVPTAGQSFSGQFRVFFSDGTNVIVPLSGTGVTTSAVASPIPLSLNFANEPLGEASAPQTVTVSNTGSAPFKIEAVRTFPPFMVSGFSKYVEVKPGKAFSVQVSFFGTAVGPATGTLTFYYDVLPPNGVTLSGTATITGSLAATTFPTLPAATQGAAYSATLTAAGGVPPYTWSLASGSTLPHQRLDRIDRGRW